MIASMFLRAGVVVRRSRARRCPNVPLRRRDVTSATMIGVLMSATLPARLGEPARAMVLARRIGRMRETFPVLLGTLVSQTVLNIVALVAARRDHRLRPPTSSTRTPRSSSSSQPGAAASCSSRSCSRRPLVRQNGSGRVARIVGTIRARAGPGALRPARLPRPAPRPARRRRAARRLGAPAARLLRAVRGARARRRARHRRRRRGPVRGQRHRGRSRRPRRTSASSSSP